MDSSILSRAAVVAGTAAISITAACAATVARFQLQNQEAELQMMIEVGLCRCVLGVCSTKRMPLLVVQLLQELAQSGDNAP